jgi:hypothetical protein
VILLVQPDLSESLACRHGSFHHAIHRRVKREIEQQFRQTDPPAHLHARVTLILPYCALGVPTERIVDPVDAERVAAIREKSPKVVNRGSVD